MVDMTPENDWEAIRGRQTPLLGAAGMGVLRVVLLFGSTAVALALILAPVADRYSRPQNAAIGGLDYTVTGSIGQRGSYTIRRSVLQKPDTVCIIQSDGRRSSGC
jgi:hypothetical protein